MARTSTPIRSSGIRVTRSGLDHEFGNGNDVVIQPGYVGLGDDAESGGHAVFGDVAGRSVSHRDLWVRARRRCATRRVIAFQNGQDETIEFRLDFGAQVVAVVPQPIEVCPTAR